jgi:hypothetical protein
MRSRYKEIRGRWREIWLERPMGDKEDPGERHGRSERPMEIKIPGGDSGDMGESQEDHGELTSFVFISQG